MLQLLHQLSDSRFRLRFLVRRRFNHSRFFRFLDSELKLSTDRGNLIELLHTSQRSYLFDIGKRKVLRLVLVSAFPERNYSKSSVECLCRKFCELLWDVSKIKLLRQNLASVLVRADGQCSRLLNSIGQLIFCKPIQSF